MSKLDLKIPPLLLTVLVGLVMVLFSRFIPAMALGGIVRGGVGSILVGIGVYFIVFGVVEFRRNNTTVDPRYPAKASALVARGVYSVSRNPMYVGFAFVLSSLVVILQSPLLIFGVAFFVWYMNRFQITLEEEALVQHFGDQYTKYKNRVRRWL